MGLLRCRGDRTRRLMNEWTNVPVRRSGRFSDDQTVIVESHRVLVVDDDPAYGRLAELVLLEGLPEGTQVRAVTTLGEALDDVAAWAPGCVLLDLSLADGDGLKAIARLRDAGHDAAVLVLTGRTDAGLEEAVAARGGDGYLVKGDELDGGLASTVTALLS